MCGNHRSYSIMKLEELGSPPRVREPRQCETRRDVLPGITPACAGTTALRDAIDKCAEDHPRVCGNHHQN